MPAKGKAKAAAMPRSPSSRAGDFVREEIEHVREGEHGARSAKQIIAIGLSKARRAGVEIPSPPGRKTAKAKNGKPNPRRSKATQQALKREGASAASREALSEQARASAKRRGPVARRKAAAKAVRTKGAAGRHAASMKAADTRARRAAGT